MKWTKISTVKKADGTTIIVYECGKYTIKSYKREIPHAGGKPGGWMYTDYTLYENGNRIRIFNTLKDAKTYAEFMENEGTTKGE